MARLAEIALMSLLVIGAAWEASAEATELKQFVSFESLRCDGNGHAFKTIENQSERQCFRKCKKKKRCNAVTYNSKKEKCFMYKKCKDGYEFNRQNIDDFSSAMRVNSETKYGGTFRSNEGRIFSCDYDEIVRIPGIDSPYQDYPDGCRNVGSYFNGAAMDKCQECCDKVKGCRVAQIWCELSDDYCLCSLFADCNKLSPNKNVWMTIKDRPTK